MRRLIATLALLLGCGGPSCALAQTVDTAVIRAQTEKIDSATAAIRRALLITPAPIPTPIPVPVPIPVPPTGKYLTLVSDYFTQYTDNKSLLANIATTNVGGTGSPSTSLYTDGYNARLATIDKTVLYNGHQTLKLSQPGGVMDVAQLWVTFPGGKTYTHIWYRIKGRFSPGYTTTGTLTNSANAAKLFDWAWAGPEGSGRLEITNTNQYDFYWNIQNGGTIIGGGNHLSPGNVTTEWSDGAWYDFIIEVDHSTKTGVARVWMGRDGEVPVLRATVTGTMKNGSALPLLNRIAVEGNFNQVRAKTQTQAVWIGQWEVVDGTQYPNPFGVR